MTLIERLDMSRLKQQRDNLLKVMIYAIETMEIRGDSPIESMYGAVEKATGKTWSEINEPR
jgi:hypothetical protein